ncbi:heme exporter protein CcmD [Candidatus Vondammii sp. HM_W22]|uniref:heme exporter protein CcmD n=1 Tax=Candidatus Vondammii sp. HM_W22 TaxID=2687299 RepID=UPI001F128C76|nr:heme exporter protein CcmD [Candidatus Vondammii sp. HM_W22]
MTISEFFNMGGYALYVWGSFGVTVLFMVIEPVIVRGGRRATLQRISRIVRLDAEERR